MCGWICTYNAFVFIHLNCLQMETAASGKQPAASNCTYHWTNRIVRSHYAIALACKLYIYAWCLHNNWYIRSGAFAIVPMHFSMCVFCVCVHECSSESAHATPRVPNYEYRHSCDAISNSIELGAQQNEQNEINVFRRQVRRNRCALLAGDVRVVVCARTKCRACYRHAAIK